MNSVSFALLGCAGWMCVLAKIRKTPATSHCSSCRLSDKVTWLIFELIPTTWIRMPRSNRNRNGPPTRGSAENGVGQVEGAQSTGGGGDRRRPRDQRQRHRPRDQRPHRSIRADKTIQAIRNSVSAMGVKVYAFLDHTNINIMSQKASGRVHNFPEGVDDMCVRAMPSKIFDFLRAFHASPDKGRDRAELAEMHCYTSDATVSGHENIGGRKITARVFRKGGWNNREKIVDTYMVADAVETIFQKKDPLVGLAALTLKDPVPGIISLWTGDMDILCPVIDKALSAGWKVEVWSYKGSMSNVVERYPKVAVRELDACVLEISDRKTGWKPNAEKIPPANASFKLRFELDSKEMEITKENWRDLVDCLTKRVDLPLQAWFNWDEALMFLILAVPGKELHNYMKIIWDRRDALQEEVHAFMGNKFGVTSTCAVIVDGNYPQQPLYQPLGRSSPIAAHSSAYRGGRGGYAGNYGSDENNYDYRGSHFARGYSGRGRGRGRGEI